MYLLYWTNFKLQPSAVSRPTPPANPPKPRNSVPLMSRALQAVDTLQQAALRE